MVQSRAIWYNSLHDAWSGEEKTMTISCGKKLVSGRITAPPSKSSMQRAVACSMLAEGTSRLHGGVLSNDSGAAIRIALALGASVEMKKDAMEITGSSLFTGDSLGKNSDADEALELDCGESGLCMRMFSPIAALLPRPTLLRGRGSLARRPMGMVELSLRELGVSCHAADGLPPLAICGPLRGGRLSIDAGESSQLLTGLLIALPLVPGDSELLVSHAVSKGYLDLTIDTCAVFGVKIEKNPGYSRFSIRGRQKYMSREFSIEGDWSGAAFLVVAAAIAAEEGELQITGLQVNSSQPDKAVLAAALMAGASIRTEQENIYVKKGRLEAFEFDATDCPDLFPPLAALAAACPGTSSIRGIHRLAGKESDRAASLKTCLESLGTKVSFDGDFMRVNGGSLHGGIVDSFGDHRIAMAAAVAALVSSETVTIQGSECVAKSWPKFFEDLGSICV